MASLILALPGLGALVLALLMALVLAIVVGIIALALVAVLAGGVVVVWVLVRLRPAFILPISCLGLRFTFTTTAAVVLAVALVLAVASRLAVPLLWASCFQCRLLRGLIKVDSLWAFQSRNWAVIR